MKSINKNKLYHVLLLVFLSLDMGISAAEETHTQDTIPVSSTTEATSSADITQAPAFLQDHTPSLMGLIKNMAVYNISQSISASLVNSYRDTIFHPAAFVAGNVTSSFVRNLYNKYQAGKLFNSGWNVLIPEDIKNTVDVYSKNKVIAPVMIACALGQVWSHYVGISPLYPSLVGAVFWALAQK